MSLDYRYGKYLRDCVQVIRNYRNRGMPRGGGGLVQENQEEENASSLEDEAGEGPPSFS